MGWPHPKGTAFAITVYLRARQVCRLDASGWAKTVWFPKSSLVNMEFQCKLCSSKKYEIQKVLSLAILGGLLTASHSVALSHYWPTQRILAAGFPLWPGPPCLRQSEPPWLPGEAHVDAGLSPDAVLSWPNSHQKSRGKTSDGQLCSSKKYESQKNLSLDILGGLPTASNSLALSHYWPTQRLLASGFPL